jgi:hypothetical protein
MFMRKKDIGRERETEGERERWVVNVVSGKFVLFCT